MNTVRLLTFIFLASPFFLNAQDEAVLLAIPSKECKISLDGIEIGQGKAGSALRIASTAGEHYLEAQSTDGGTKGEVVHLEKGKQKIVKIDFAPPAPSAAETIAVADINFDLPGSVTTIAWASEHENEPYPYPTYYYAFEKGDEIILDVTMSNKKGTNIINIFTHPDGVERYSNNTFTELNEHTIKVPQRSIYKFVFGSNHAFDRNCFVKIRRKPASAQTSNFNTIVTLKEVFTPVAIQEAQDFYINSGSNSAFLTGKSRVTIPITLPANTVEWYYRFSASRNKADIDNVKSNFKLFGDMTTFIFGFTGPAATMTSALFGQLAQPPGADYCDIYLLDTQYHSAFLNKLDDQWRYLTDGSRANYKSGNVRVSCCRQGQYVIGIRNPSVSTGVNVSVEIVAITMREEWGMGE